MSPESEAGYFIGRYLLPALVLVPALVVAFKSFTRKPKPNVAGGMIAIVVVLFLAFLFFFSG